MNILNLLLSCSTQPNPPHVVFQCTNCLFPLSFPTGSICALFRWFLEQLPVESYNLLIYLLTFLRELLKYEEKNRLTGKQLATVFSQFLVFRPYVDGVTHQRFLGSSSGPLLVNTKQVKTARLQMEKVLRYLLMCNKNDLK